MIETKAAYLNCEGRVRTIVKTYLKRSKMFCSEYCRAVLFVGEAIDESK